MKKKAIDDPHLEREKAKYENPVPSREYILTFLEERGKPANISELFKAFELKEDIEQEAIRRRLRAMVRDGQLVRNRRGSYGLIDKMDLLRGRVIGHRDGFGFIALDQGGDDLFLSPREMRTVFSGDIVLARVIGTDNRGRKEAQIVEVLESRTTQLVGRFNLEGGVGFVIPDNKHITKEIMIQKEMQGDAKDRQIVVVDIIAQPTLRHRPLGKIVEILGEHMDPGMEIDIALRSYDLPYEWTSEVLKEIKQFSQDVSENDLKDRADLRDLPFVTIDGEDARDFDDAVYCKKKPKGGWILYVAIADVSHYVKPGTALDLSAYGRGNSVYFPGETIPMLPEVLSNGLCSLNPKVNRLCLVCEMSVSATGKASRYRFYEAVIYSHARLTYSKVTSMLNGDNELIQKYEPLFPHLKELENLYNILHKQRQKRGAIDFETVETQFIFDKSRKIKSIVPIVRTISHRIIEECMLLANVCAARFIEKNKIPGLYRVHEAPQSSKLADLREFLLELGLQLRGGRKPRAIDFSKLLEATRDRDDSQLIQTVMLRSLQQAVYSPDNLGHFGLAYTEYTHYTSPIRRYPDLVLHRAIKHVLQHDESKGSHYTHEQMVEMGQHCSSTERRADEATRDVENWLKCEFMSHRIGDEYEGIIVAVTGFGLFVQLRDIYVEGLVHVTALQNDYYHFDPIRHRLIGDRTRTRYCLGDTIRVRVSNVDIDERQIDFDLVLK